MKYVKTNIVKQNNAIALNADSVNNLINLPINIIILLGINLILSLIIIKG